MVSSEFVIEVTETNFQFEVLEYSRQTPVIVDFWAEWCGPCRMLGPILEHLVNEADGRFRLAKLNVDENPNLAIRFGIRGIPAVKAFRNGELVSEFIGVLPEDRIRAFLGELAPSSTDLEFSKGINLLHSHDWIGAEDSFRNVVDEMSDPKPMALLGLAKSLLAQGEGRESLKILNHFPASKEFQSAELLIPLAKAISDWQRDERGADHIEAMLERNITLIRRSNFPAAMDGLLDILREDKNYRNGIARMLMLAIFEVLGSESDLAREYRNELASILF